MVYGNYGYSKSISSLYKYNYNSMKSSYSTANTAGVGSNSPVSKSSYFNSDAVKALNDIKTNASALKDSLSLITQASTFKKIYAESSAVESTAGKSAATAIEDTNSGTKQSALAGLSRNTRAESDSAAAINASVKRSTEADTNRVSADDKKDMRKDTQADEKQAANVERNSKPAADAAKGLVDSFNKLANSSKNNSRLTGDLKNAFASYASDLNKLGITSDSNGKLTIDNNKLDKAASDGSLQSLFSKAEDSGSFTGNLTKIANNAAKGSYGVSDAFGANRQQQPSQSAQNLTNAYNYSRNNNSNVHNYMFGTSGGSTLGALFNLYA